jgi:hypothetical protein
MRFVLLVGCLSLSAWAAVVTLKLRNLNRKFAGFPPIYGNAALMRGSSRGAVQRRSYAARRSPPEVLEACCAQLAVTHRTIKARPRVAQGREAETAQPPISNRNGRPKWKARQWRLVPKGARTAQRQKSLKRVVLNSV